MRLLLPFLLLFVADATKITRGHKGCWEFSIESAETISPIINRAKGHGLKHPNYVKAAKTDFCYYTFTFPEGPCREAKDADRIQVSGQKLSQSVGLDFEYDCLWNEADDLTCVFRPDFPPQLGKLVRYIGNFAKPRVDVNQRNITKFEQSSCVLLLLNDVRDNIQKHPGCLEGNSTLLSRFVTGKNGRVGGCPPMESAFMDSCRMVDPEFLNGHTCFIRPQYDPIAKVEVPWVELSNLTTVASTLEPESKKTSTLKPEIQKTTKVEKIDKEDDDEEDEEEVATESPEDPNNSEAEYEEDPSDSEKADSPSKPFPTWAIVAASVGAVILLATIILLILVFKRRSAKQKQLENGNTKISESTASSE